MSDINDFIAKHDYRCWCGQQASRRVCHQLFGRRPFAVLACTACQTHRILPKAANDQSGVEALYNQYEAVEASPVELKRNKTRMLRRMAEVGMQFNASKKVIDVGCGTGLLIEALCTQYGCEGKGIDVDARRISLAQVRSKKARFECGLLDPAKTTERYNAVVANAVFEHVLAPVQFLQDLKAVLTPDGDMFLLTPNAASLSYRVLGSWWRELLSIGEHIYLFNPASLEHCASQAGLRVMAFSSDYDCGFPELKFGTARQAAISGWGVYRESIKHAAKLLSGARTGDLLYARLRRQRTGP